MGIPEDSTPSPSPPPSQYLEVICRSSGKTLRFAAGTDAGFAVALINRNLKEPLLVATHIEAVKDGEEPIAFGPNAILSDFGKGWKLQTVTLTQPLPSGKFNKTLPHLEDERNGHVPGMAMPTPAPVSGVPGDERMVSKPISLLYIVKIVFAFVLIFVLGAIFTVFLDNLPALILFVKSII